MSRLLLGLILLTLAGALSGCGSERDGTGVWQQICDEEAAAPCDEAYVYELHLGRYGDQLSGIVVRYLFEDIALEPFQRTNECGCFLITSGRMDDTQFGFTLYEPALPRIPDTSFQPVQACAPSATSIPAECDDRIFDLREAGDQLDGTIACGDSARPIRFRRVAGRPRTACHEAPQ